MVDTIDKTKILFRASSSGNLLTKKSGGFTESNQKEINKLESKMMSGKSLTELQDKKLNELYAKRDAPYELSDTVKSMVQKMFLEKEYGYREFITTKGLIKGTEMEDVGISLISKLDNKFYIKNTERKTDGVLTGEADVVDKENRIIHDIKCPDNIRTFMSSKMTRLYKVQGLVYLYLWDMDIFKLRYVLVNAPEHQIQSEIYRQLMNAHETDDSEKGKKIIEQVRRNMIYDHLPIKDRVKTFVVKRDDSVINELFDVIKHCLEYYKTLTINDTNGEEILID